MIRFILAAWTLVFLVPLSAQRSLRTLYSPGKLTAVTVGLNKTGEPFYKITYRGKTAIDWSRLGFMTQTFDLRDGFTLLGCPDGQAR